MSQMTTSHGQAGEAGEDVGRTDDAAVEFLSSLQPEDPAVRRRAFAALLRAVAREAGQ
jgi:hypothetical protein